jgi:hypothetical protein
MIKEIVMPIKFFCKVCSKEMWQGITEDAKKETTTIYDLEQRCVCSDCIMAENWYRRACEKDQLREIYEEEDELKEGGYENEME